MKLFIEINLSADDIKIHSRGNKRIQETTDNYEEITEFFDDNEL